MVGNCGKGILPSSGRRRGRKSAENKHITNKDHGIGSIERNGYRDRSGGLIKQSFTIEPLTGKHLHLILYYNRIHLTSSELQRPTTDPQLRYIVPVNEIYPGSTIHTSLTPYSGEISKQPPCIAPTPGHSQVPSIYSPFDPDSHAPNAKRITRSAKYLA